MAVLPTGIGPVTGGYQIERSLRFNSADSAYLNRTPASSPTSNQKFTLSCWFKRTALGGTYPSIYSANDAQVGGGYPCLSFANDAIYIQLDVGGTTKQWTTTQLFRDLSAWYHIVWAVDTTQATATDRMKLYINGSLVTAYSTQETVTQNGTFSINGTTAQQIGNFVDYSRYLNGYLTEFYMIDGQQLAASSFGETDSATGVWKPKAYSGTYGTNGFYLPFKTASNWSGYFDGTGDYVSIPTSNTLMHQIGNWTYEGWIYWNSMPTAGYQNVFGQGAAGQNSFGLAAYNGSSWSAPYKFVVNQANIGNRIVGTTTLVAGTWYHFAVVRNSGVVTLYVNGTAEGTYSNSTDYAFGGNPFTIGNSSNGYISNFRFNRSAVYTANFTPPTTQLTAITNTQLLTCQSSTFVDNSANGFTVTAVGDARPQQFSPFTLDVTDDHSGTGNNWQPNNLDLRTTGVGGDILVDSPTAYGTDTGVGGEVRGNYCTWNRLQTSSSITLNNGNLDATISGGFLIYSAAGTVEVTTGKWYYETVVTAGFSTNYPLIGVCDVTQITSAINTSFYSTAGSGDTTGIIARGKTNVYLSNNTSTSDGVTYNYTSDVIMIALDADLGKVWFGKNGTWNNSSNPATNTGGHTFSTVSGKGYRPYVQCNADTSNSWTSNFGQRAFAYTAPSGFKALCTTNLPTPTIGASSTTLADDYFNVKLYSGNGNTGQTITGVGFQPDFVWLKNRNQGGGYPFFLYDAVRGAGYGLRSNATNAEENRTAIFSAFASDGFTFPAGQGNTLENDAAGTYASWNWNAGGSNATNTVGTITSTVRANTTAGFSIVTYTGNSTSSQTVGHGLGVTPGMVIVKDRSSGTTNDWRVWHSGLTGGNNELRLNTTAAQATDATTFSSAPTATVINYGNNTAVNGSARTYVAYVFAPVAGYSAFGSYASNNSLDNAFVYCGFRPRWIMIKSSTTGGVNYDWLIFDTARMSYNYIANTELRANLTTTEGGLARNPKLDILSNGFKVRDSAGEIGSSTTYIFAAFAETPFKYALAR